MAKNFFFKSPLSRSVNKAGLFHINLIGKAHRFLLKKRLALNINHPFGGLKKQSFIKLQKHLKNQSNFINQNKLKEDALLKVKKRMGYRNSRIERNLPLRGQRTHTNAKTRKKRKIL